MKCYNYNYNASNFCLFFSTNVFAKDFYRYFGFGKSTGSYEESKYNLDEDLSSDSYVYGNYFASDKSNLLSTTLFAQLTQFELQTTDREQQSHDLSVMLIGLNWAKGLSANISYFCRNRHIFWRNHNENRTFFSKSTHN